MACSFCCRCRMRATRCTNGTWTSPRLRDVCWSRVLSQTCQRYNPRTVVSVLLVELSAVLLRALREPIARQQGLVQMTPIVWCGIKDHAKLETVGAWEAVIDTICLSKQFERQLVLHALILDIYKSCVPFATPRRTSTLCIPSEARWNVLVVSGWDWDRRSTPTQ